jgi:uncharacterized protein (DUF927 family)
MSSPDPFAPLTTRINSIKEQETNLEPVPITPVPLRASPARLRHSQFGEPSATWTYKTEGGLVLGHVARFEAPNGKQILPRTWCRLADGAEAWRWRAFESPRPLYNLDLLHGRPGDVVLLVEGEKTADAAQQCCPNYVAVTWPGGTNAIRKVDWSPLTERDVIVWPDADEPGRKAARDTAELVLEAGAASVSLVELPDDLPTGWDLADPVPEGVDVYHLLATARPISAATELPSGYAMTARGLVWSEPDDEESPELLLAGPFEIVAETRDRDGSAWGVLLRWKDHDGREHHFALPRSILAGDGADARRVLLDGGLYVAPRRAARERLTAFLTLVHSGARVTATTRIGWHGSAFVLPEESIRGRGGERHILQGVGAGDHALHQKGSLQEWQDHVAAYAVGNSRLVLALSTAFAASLVGPCQAESAGIHLRGASSTGKSTALAMAGSVWGGGEPGGYVRSWRATANGLEGVALGHCDSLLCLDELGELGAADAGEVAYMLANGTGKSRSTRDGSVRKAARWRLLFLSSGEIGLAEKAAELGSGRRLAPGQQVRILDLPADGGVDLGVFEHLQGFPSAELMARQLKTDSANYYGTAARKFLRYIVKDLEGLRTVVSARSKDFIERYVPDEADGQVQRAANRFALIAAAGEIAVEAGVVPWPPGEATKAAGRCFGDWLNSRGGTEAPELREGIEQVRAFLLAHGISRFVPAWEVPLNDAVPTREIAGYRKQEGEGWDYYVTTSAWRKELCAGYNAQSIAAALAERGMLLVQDDRHRAKAIKIPGHNKVRAYHLRAAFLEADRE